MFVKRFGINTLFRIIGAGIGLISLPLIVQVLGVEKYGVWATLMSVVTWIVLFDFGLSYSLKNTISASLANGDMELAKEEMIKILEIMFFLSLVILTILVAWFVFDGGNNIYYYGFILYFPIIVFLPVSIGGVILQGARCAHIQSVANIFPSLILLLLCFYYKIFSNEIADIRVFSLFYVIALISSWLFCFFYGMRFIDFKFRDFKFYFSQRKKIKYRKFGVAIRFFILQISSYVLYSSGNIFIYGNFDNVDVAMYDIVNKVYLFGIGLFNMIVSFFWAEIAFYFERKEWIKIKKIYFSLLVIAFLFSLGSMLMVFLIPMIVDFLSNNSIKVKSDFPIYLGGLVAFQAIAYVGALFLNAFEKISVQVVIAIFSMVLYYPLMRVLLNFQFEISAVPLASIILTVTSMLYCNLHAYSLIKKGCDV